MESRLLFTVNLENGVSSGGNTEQSDLIIQYTIHEMGRRNKRQTHDISTYAMDVPHPVSSEGGPKGHRPASRPTAVVPLRPRERLHIPCDERMGSK